MTQSKKMRCAWTGHVCAWPGDFPSPMYAICHKHFDAFQGNWGAGRVSRWRLLVNKVLRRP